MAKSKKELVRDGFLGDLPEEIQLKIMNVHKLLTSTCEEVWKDKAYDPIREEDWARTAIEEFCTQPVDNNLVGSVRVYKQGKRNSCMIQVTGHVINHRNDINHELLHDFFRHVHHDMRQKVRKQFDMRLTCESEHGEPFEGFDVWPSSKVAKVIWELFEDKKTKVIKEGTDEYMSEFLWWGKSNKNKDHIDINYIDKLPNDLSELILNLNKDINNRIYSMIDKEKLDYRPDHDGASVREFIAYIIGDTNIVDDTDVLSTRINKSSDESYNGCTHITSTDVVAMLYPICSSEFLADCIKLFNPIIKKIYDDISKDFNDKYPGKTLVLGNTDPDKILCILLKYDNEYSKKIWNYNEDPKKYPMEESYIYNEKMFAEIYELPNGLEEFIESLNDNIIDIVSESSAEIACDMLANSYGDVILTKDNDDKVHGSILVNECKLPRSKNIINRILKECKITDDSTKVLSLNESGNIKSFEVILNTEYASKLWNYLENTDPDQVFEEKKTQEEYNINKFKKDYKYNPKDSTIDVDGKRIKVDIGNSGIIEIMNQHTPRQTSSILQGDEKIVLDSSFFKLKNPKRRDAILQHEIGHLKMHSLDADNRKLFDKKFIDKSIIESLLKTSAISAGITDTNSINEFINTWINSDSVKEFLDKKVTDKNLDDLRSSAKKAAMKYTTGNNKHLNITEIEADRYAANKVSEKDLKRGIKELSKNYSKPKNINQMVKNSIKSQYKNAGYTDDEISYDGITPDLMKRHTKDTHIQQHDDVKKRSKALKDKELRSNPIYRESYENDIIFDPFMEANNSTPEYNTDMSEAEAKKTLRTVSQNIINDIENKKDYKVTQYTANIYANIITKNLLPLWANGFRKLTITLDSYQSFNTFEFKVPKMTQDFVSRFIRGRESINGFIHRSPEINIRMSPRIFHTMKNPDDAFNFFRSAIKYYNNGLEKYSDKLMVETMKLNHELKHLISTTKLSGIVTCPMQLLFIFDNVDISNKDTFKISQDDIKTVNQFIRNIYTRYAAPEKEKKQIVDDVNEMIKSLKESCDTSDENIRQLTYLPEAVNDYLFGKFENVSNEYNEEWMTEQFDMDWIRHQKNPEVKYLQEKFGVKKLKKIPSDLVAYITIETEAIRDANDKMMISSYCLSKLEIVEWYIELLTVGSKKYIVPHTKPYLESVRTQLLACFDRIMKVKITNPNDRPIIDIKYPKNYEG